jgi:hypothetical protein
MAVRRRRRPGDHVAATALGSLRVRRVPELLDRGREELHGVHACALRAAVELFDQPRERRRADVTVLLCQLQLRVPRPPFGQLLVEGLDASPDLLGAELTHLDAHLVMGPGDPVELERMGRHPTMVSRLLRRLPSLVTLGGYG